MLLLLSFKAATESQSPVWISTVTERRAFSILMNELKRGHCGATIRWPDDVSFRPCCPFSFSREFLSLSAEEGNYAIVKFFNFKFVRFFN